MHELPDEFVQRLKLIIHEQHRHAVLNSFSAEKPLTVRVNTLRNSVENITRTLEQAGIPFSVPLWQSHAIIIDNQWREHIINSEQYRDGQLYSQNLSSQLVPLILDPQADEEILDMCAAPGSKTCQIACLMHNHGRLAAVEKIRKRFFKLRANLAQQHVTNAHTYLDDATGLWRKTPERFDRILLDAPCSSEARFNTNDAKSFSHWSPRKIRECARKQKKLIASAIQCLKPGGTLVYSTCSFAPEENEAVLDHALARFHNVIEMQALPLPIDNYTAGLTQWQDNSFSDSVRHARRIIPDGVMEGFFIAKLRKLA